MQQFARTEHTHKIGKWQREVRYYMHVRTSVGKWEQIKSTEYYWEKYCKKKTKQQQKQKNKRGKFIVWASYTYITYIHR